MANFVQKQAERALEQFCDRVEEHVPTPLVRNDDDEKVAFALAVPRKPIKENLDKPTFYFNRASAFDVKPDKEKLDRDRKNSQKSDRRDRESQRYNDDEEEDKSRRERRDDDRGKRRRDDDRSSTDRSKKSRSEEKLSKNHRHSALEEIRAMEEQKKERDNRKDHWLHKNIVVKVVTDKLGKQYYKQKGVVKELIDDYTAEVKMIDGGDVLRLDQVHCETVIPAIGKTMLIVNGAYRGTSATLDAIDEAKFALSLTLAQGHAQGRKLTGIPYEDACKLA